MIFPKRNFKTYEPNEFVDLIKQDKDKLKEIGELQPMKTFKTFMKDEALDKLIAEASLTDIQNIFNEVDLDIIEPDKVSGHENLKRFSFTAMTRKGTRVSLDVGLSELLTIGFIKNLIRISYS